MLDAEAYHANFDGRKISPVQLASLSRINFPVIPLSAPEPSSSHTPQAGSKAGVFDAGPARTGVASITLQCQSGLFYLQ